MADPITWGLINIVKKGVKGVQTTLDGVKNSVDTLPEDVQTKLDAFEVTINELKKNVEDTLAEVQETVENSPAGSSPAQLKEISSRSTEEGIEITYTANVSVPGGTTDTPTNGTSEPITVTKGIMFRYSDTEYPLSPKEGNLAFVDEDIFTVDEYGKRIAIEKKSTIVGLTNNKTYYISAFPYSYYNVYNVGAGYVGMNDFSNRTKCQWTGTKGTLTVNVTQDYDYKPLGEYTATLTPTAGGDPITKTQSGAATVVFSGLEAGEYTLSFSEVASFTKPSNQSVTVTAGQSQVLDLQYQLNVSLSSLSWAEIDEYAQMGVANKLFSVGDTKDVSVSGETLTFEIVGFNHDDLADGSGKAKITFGMKNLMGTTRQMNSTDTSSGSYEGSAMNDYVSGDFYGAFPSDLQAVIKSVKKVTGKGGGSTVGTRTDNFNIWLFSEKEVFGSNTYSIDGEGSKYAKFTSNSSRIKKLSNGSGSTYKWWLRSPFSKGISTLFCSVNTDGNINASKGAATYLGVCVGFCV